MKKTIVVFALLALALTSCTGEDSVVGKWQLESVTGEELTDSEKEATMVFNDNGTCENKRGERARKAKYKASDDGKTITLVMESGTKDKMEDVTLTAELLTFKNGNDVITYKRIE